MVEYLYAIQRAARDFDRKIEGDKKKPIVHRDVSVFHSIACIGGIVNI